jgi:hypothetical protein
VVELPDATTILAPHPGARNADRARTAAPAAYPGQGASEPVHDPYIDVHGGCTAAGGPIDAWPCNGCYTNQYFLSLPG